MKLLTFILLGKGGGPATILLLHHISILFAKALECTRPRTVVVVTCTVMIGVDHVIELSVKIRAGGRLHIVIVVGSTANTGGLRCALTPARHSSPDTFADSGTDCRRLESLCMLIRIIRRVV